MKVSIILIFIFALLALQCFCHEEESPSFLESIQSRVQALESMHHAAKQEIFMLHSKLGEINNLYTALASAANVTIGDILPIQ